MKRTLRRILTMVLCMMTLCFVFIAPASADNVCKQIKGSSKAETVFTVDTGSRWLFAKDYLKLTQTKGIMNIERIKLTHNEKATREMYELYSVKVEKLVKGKVKSTKVYEWESKTLKIKLDKNAFYRITVTSTYVKYHGKYPGGGLFNPYEAKGLKGLVSMWWIPLGWKKHSTWSVSATKGILACK